MNKAYRLLLGLCAAAATLSSCSRSTYSFNNSVPAYLGSQPTHAVAAAPAPTAPVAAAVATEPTATAEPVAAAEPVVPVAPAVAFPAKASAVAATPKAAKVLVATPQADDLNKTEQLAAAQQRLAEATTAQAQTKPAKPNLVQRLMLKKLSKQLAKAQLNHQNSAETTRIGGGLAIIIVGVALAIIGAIVSSGALAVIGGIIIVIGIVVLLLSIL